MWVLRCITMDPQERLVGPGNSDGRDTLPGFNIRRLHRRLSYFRSRTCCVDIRVDGAESSIVRHLHRVPERPKDRIWPKETWVTMKKKRAFKTYQATLDLAERRHSAR